MLPKPAKTRPCASFFVFILLFALLGCGEQKNAPVKLAGSTMGTTYHITVVDEVVDVESLHSNIEQMLASVNQSMSTYIADSELNQLNQVGVGEFFSLSNDLCKVLSLSNDIFSLSQGAFDPTIGPLVDLWGFGAGSSQERFKPPSTIEVEKAMKSVGYQHLNIDCNALTVSKSADVNIDLSAVAKGYGVDVLADWLWAQGYKNYLVEIGGEVRVTGLNSSAKPWRIAIEKPNLLTQQIQKVVNLSDIAMATSGDYRNYFEYQEQRYSHTLDPLNGYPVNHQLVSVTVLDASSAKADALATAFLVMGNKKALALANRFNIPAFFLVNSETGYNEHSSNSFIQLVEGES